MAPHFFPLTVIDVRSETKDCVSVGFAVPSELRVLFEFQAGQYLTLRTDLEGEDVRRSYSICSSPHSGLLRVAVKRVDGGLFSEFATRKLRVGDQLQVMPPDGRFLFQPSTNSKRNIVAIAAGSGITPILSIATTLLEREPQSQLTLLYGNRRVRDIIFKEQIEDLRDRFLTRFTLIHSLTQEPQESPVSNGRIDQEKIFSIFGKKSTFPTINEAYVCGPGELIDCVIPALKACGVAESHIHHERFTAGSSSQSSTKSAQQAAAGDQPLESAKVVVIADGIERVLRVPKRGESILEAALAAGIDAPFACKAGVCCTCRAQVLEGEVSMDVNFTLEAHEVNRGFVLTCQAHPISECVKISYDAR